MAKPRKHHFVPKFYLAGFCPDDREMLVVYDRARKAYRSQRPAEVAHRRDYYAYEDEDGNQYFDIEEGLGEIETTTSAVIQKVDAGEALSTEDRYTLATYVGFQFARTPAFQAMYETLYRSVAEKSAEIAKAHLGDQMKPEHLGGLADGLGEKIDRRKSLGTMLRLAPKFASLFMQMNWIIWHRPSDKTSFITTDSPYCQVRIRPSDGGFYDGVGILSPDTLNIFPLSQGSCLGLHGIGDRTAYLRLGTVEVRRINLSVTSQCQHFVFGRDQRLVENLVQTTGIDKREWQMPLRIG